MQNLQLTVNPNFSKSSVSQTKSHLFKKVVSLSKSNTAFLRPISLTFLFIEQIFVSFRLRVSLLRQNSMAALLFPARRSRSFLFVFFCFFAFVSRNFRTKDRLLTLWPRPHEDDCKRKC